MSLLQRFKQKGGGGGDANKSNRKGSSSSTVSNSDNVSEGFVCPECRIIFVDQNALARHFADTHSSNTSQSSQSQPSPKDSSGSFVCPQCFAECKDGEELQSHFSALHELSENRDGDVLAMRMELNDLRASIKEEKWYSVELKKELDKMHSKMQENIRPPVEAGDEIGYYLQQIQVLEAGKGLVTTRMLEMEKQLNETQRACENLRREKDRFMEKSASLSQDLASTMSQLDELTGEKCVIIENLTKLQEKVVDLEAQLDARPSEDDVAVLRKELIHAQTLMDQVSRETENDAASWQIKCTQLESKCVEYEEIVNKLTQKMEKDDVEKLKQKEESSERELKKVYEEKNALIEEINNYKKLVIDVETKCDEAIANVTKMLTEKNSLNEKLFNLEENYKKVLESNSKLESEIVDLRAASNELQSTVDASKSDSEHFKSEICLEMDKARKNNEQLESKNAELSENLSSNQAKLDELRKNYKNLEKTFGNLKNERDELQRKLQEVENRLNNEQLESDRLQKTADSHRENLLELEKVRKSVEKSSDENKKLSDQLSQFVRKDEETAKIIDDLKSNGRNLESKCDEFNHELEKKSTKIKELENSLKKINEEKDNLSKEKMQMVDKLQAGEGAVSTALQQLSAEKTHLEQKILRSEEEFAEIKSKMDEKCDEYQQNIRQLNQKLNEVEDSRIKLELAMSSEKEKLIKSDETIVELKNEIQKKDQQLTDSGRHFSDFERKSDELYAKLKESYDSVCREKDSLSVDLDNRKRSVDELQSQVDELSLKFESELQITNSLNKKLDALELNFSDKMEETETTKKLLKEAQQEILKHKNNCESVEKTLSECNEKFSITSKEKNDLASELAAKEEKYQTLQANFEEMKKENSQTEANSKLSIEQTSKKCDELQKELEAISNKFQLTATENVELKEKVDHLKTSHVESSKRIGELSGQLKDREQNFVRHKEESSIAIKSSQQIVDELKAECLRLQTQLNITMQISQQESSELTMLVSNMETTVEDLRKQIKSSETRENESQNVIQRIKTDMEASKNEIQTKQAIIDEYSLKIQELETILSQIRNELKQKTKDEELARNNIDSLNNELEILRNSSKTEISSKDVQLKELQTIVDELNREIDVVQTSSTTFAENLAEFEKKYEKISAENVSVLSELNETKRSYADLDATRIQLESLLKDMQHEMDSELTKNRTKIQKLEDDKAELTLKCRSFEELTSNLQENLQKSENDIQKFEEACKIIRNELENECKSLKAHLTDLESENHQKAKEYSTKMATLENSQSVLNENLSQMQKEIEETRNELETTKKELKITSNAKKDLEAQLNAWSEEKRMLLERCLNFEKDVEEEKDNGRELKRRLDDAISAMHELGRENQSMQIDMSKHFNRKWADDNEAVNCTACGKQFSLAIRKHHCRHCGMIFCNECSLKQSTVASSKRPVRVCDNCFVELTSR